MTRTLRHSTVVQHLAWVAILVTNMQAADSSAPQTPQASPASVPERLAEMRHHFTQVSTIHEAIIRGDLPAVRVPALALANLPLPAGLPLVAPPFVAAVRQAARRAADATTLGTAASATVSMLTQCAACHRAANVRPSPSTPRRPDVGGIVGHMLEHQRAADEMLLGLLIPSDSQWRQGADRLRAAVMRPSELPPDPKLTQQIRAAEDAVHLVANRAASADTADARAASYIQVLTSCAECHGLHKTIWGPRTAQR